MRKQCKSDFEKWLVFLSFARKKQSYPTRDPGTNPTSTYLVYINVTDRQTVNYYYYGWMNGWPAMETDDVKAVMKTPANSAATFFNTNAQFSIYNEERTSRFYVEILT